VDKNVETGEDPDAGITMGLYSYPVLMAADILMFNAHKVPSVVTRSSTWKLARDIGQRFNHLFGQGKEFFTMPEALIEESVATLPGLDAANVESYDNTIPLFSSAKEMKERFRGSSPTPCAGRSERSGQFAPVHPVPGLATPARQMSSAANCCRAWVGARRKNRLVPVAGQRIGRVPAAL